MATSDYRDYQSNLTPRTMGTMEAQEIEANCLEIISRMRKLQTELNNKCSDLETFSGTWDITEQLDKALLSNAEEFIPFKPYFQELKNNIFTMLKPTVIKILQNEKNAQTVPDQSSANVQHVAISLPVESKHITELEQFRCESEAQGFNSICGMERILYELKSMFLLSLLQPQLYANMPVYNTLLLYGPPGCGKTQLVHALSTELQIPLYCITAGNILSKYVGKSEENILKVFNCLRNSGTASILLVDEIDAFCRTRCSDEQTHTRNVKVEFMNQLNHQNASSKVIVIAATNVPWEIDSAIMRRFQKHMFCDLPNDHERSKLLKFYLHASMPTLPDEIICENQGDWDATVALTAGYSSSDLKEVVRCALHKPIDELNHISNWTRVGDKYAPVDYNRTENQQIDLISSVYDLPEGTATTRSLTVQDLLNSIDAVKRTVSAGEMVKFHGFHGQLTDSHVTASNHQH